MKTRIPNSNLIAVVILLGLALAVAQFLFAADQKQARVTEVIRDVNLLSARAAARAAVVNDTVHEGSSVRTGTESRAELLFLDRTITRLGANTVFSFGAGARTYDLGSGAILISAPKSAGSVQVRTAVATSAVSGFIAIWEGHRNNWNKVLLFEGDGWVALKKNPKDHRHVHDHQMLIFRSDATVLPEPIDFSVCAAISNGLLITGFTNQLPGMPVLAAMCDKEKSSPGKTALVDPTGQDVTDQSINAHPEESAPPPPKPTIPPGRGPRRP
jgi:hypothetical protein